MLLVSEPVLGAEEELAVADVVRSGWITMGPRVRAFEQAFAAMHEVDDCVAVASCTAALHLALAALDIGPGDEVLVPSLTFVATANSVLYVGAEPVFVDIEALDRPVMSMRHARECCTARTRAVILVHFAGTIVDAEAWRDFADSRGLALVEDSAHCVAVDGAGRIGDAACFSFYGNKNLTTAEGGMVFMRDPARLDRVRLMRGHGMTSGTFARLNSRTAHYDVVCLGYNYRMDELRAAIGLIQLSHVQQWTSHRQRLAGAYRAALGRLCPAVAVPFTGAEISANHIFPILLPEGADRDEVIGLLRDSKVQSTIHYPPVHQLTFYRERCKAVSLPISEAFAARELTLPLHPAMGEEDVDLVASALALALAAQHRHA
jgi:dTDP-4-amino-4,6-dideoxygalactose transaminase